MINHVADTAFMVAAYRAQESERSDALFIDPLASKLAGEKGKAIIAGLPPSAFLGGWTVILRTVIIDEMIIQAIDEGIDAVLSLGAGLDARPYRLALPPDLLWVEADQPAVIDWKNSMLASDLPHCQLERVALDLSDIAARTALLKKLSTHAKKILVLTEAVIPYLQEKDVMTLASELRDCKSIYGWLTDYFSPEAYRFRRNSKMTEALKNAPFQFEPEDFFGFFEKTGWLTREIKYLAETARRVRRPPPFPLRMKLVMSVVRALLPRKTRAKMDQYVGYVLLEPRK